MASSSKVKAEVRRITPEIAKAMLEKNTKNRMLTSSRVASLTRAIKDGQWKLNGETIITNGTGDIIDGQHRLNAIVEANQAVDVLVVEGVESNVFDTIDRGAFRSYADTLHIQGEPHSRILGSTVREFFTYLRGTPHTDPSGRLNATVQELERVLQQHPGLRDSVSYVLGAGLRGNVANRDNAITATAAATLHYVFSQKDPKQADEFFKGLVTGENLTRQSPAFVCREKLRGMRSDRSFRAYTKRDVAALVTKAWNAFRRGDELPGHFTWRGNGPNAESFPVAE